MNKKEPLNHGLQKKQKNELEKELQVSITSTTPAKLLNSVLLYTTSFRLMSQFFQFTKIWMKFE